MFPVALQILGDIEGTLRDVYQVGSCEGVCTFFFFFDRFLVCPSPCTQSLNVHFWLLTRSMLVPGSHGPRARHRHGRP